jgi:hypothetical protein
MVEGRAIEWELLAKDFPPERRFDLDFLVDQLDWEGNVDTHFRDHHYLEPIPVADSESEGWMDKWVTYGKFDGQELFTAKETTLMPGVKTVIKDGGAYGATCVQGVGKIGKLRMQSPSMIRFGAMTEDEAFVSHDAAVQGVTYENTGAEPLVILRYFGPDSCPNAPDTGAFKKLKRG